VTVGSGTADPVPADAPSAAPTPSFLDRFWELYPALRVPAYRMAWFSMLPNQFAQTMGQLATGYAAYTLSGSATTLGWVSFALGVPGMLLTPLAGVVADRFPRVHVLLASQVLMTLTTLSLVGVIAAGALEIWHLIVLSLVQSVVFAFNGPARQALISDIVSRGTLRNASALNMAGMSVARIIGPSVAGVMVAIPVIGLLATYSTMAGLYAASTLLLVQLAQFLRIPFRPPRRAHTESPWAQMREGFSYVAASTTLRRLILMGLVPVLLSMPIQSIMPVFAEVVFDRGGPGLGLLSAALGVGSLAGALVAATLHSVKRPFAAQVLIGIALGISLVCFALAPGFWLAVSLLVLVGFFQACFAALNTAQIVSVSEPRLQGRVMGLYMMTFFLMPIVSLPLAACTELIGAPLTVLGCGIGVLLSMLFCIVAGGRQSRRELQVA
jgi:MFS family permease